MQWKLTRTGFGKTSSYCKQERIDAGLSRGMQVMVRFKVRGHLQTKIFTLNVIGGGGGLWQMSMTLIFEISIARAQKDINSMQVQ